MKKVIIISKSNVDGIDWSKRHYVNLRDQEHGDYIVITTGKHTDTCFEGFALPSEKYPLGQWSDDWYKTSFQVFSGTATLEISNTN